MSGANLSLWAPDQYARRGGLLAAWLWVEADWEEQMKLAELEPIWINENMFAFRCPHCQKVWLTCKNVVIDNRGQRNLVISAGLEPTGPRYGAVLSKPNMAWSWDENDFMSMTITPSIDASKSGHWHGFITKGEIK